MRDDKKNHTLDDLFAEAKNVPSVLSDEKIDTLINTGSESGRRSLRWFTTSSKQRTIMNTLALALAASSLGIGILYLSPRVDHRTPEIAAYRQTAPSMPSTPDIGSTTSAAEPKRQPVSTVAPVLAPSPSPVMNRADKPGRADDVTPKEDREKLAQEFEERLGHDAAEYWTAKINGYKSRIDDMLSSSDLTDLNKLRARWEILKSLHETSEHDRSPFKVANPTDPAMEQQLSTVPHGSVSVRFGAKQNSNTDSMETTVQSVYSTSEDGTVMNIDTSKTVDAAMMVSMLKMMMAQDKSERGTIVNSVRDISARYQPQMVDLRKAVIRDFVEFMAMIMDRTKSFVEEHKDDMGQELEPFIDREEMIRGSESLFGKIDENNTGLEALYDLMIEPEILLYNGSEVSDLISDAVIKPVTGMKLPENSVLQQSFPNPAVSNVTIAYTLNEPSSSTLVRLYDATGNAVLTKDEGARSNGSHTVDIDVSGLPNGTYLYQLSIATPRGERVFSKTLQVVH